MNITYYDIILNICYTQHMLYKYNILGHNMLNICIIVFSKLHDNTYKKYSMILSNMIILYLKYAC